MRAVSTAAVTSRVILRNLHEGSRLISRSRATGTRFCKFAGAHLQNDTTFAPRSHRHLSCFSRSVVVLIIVAFLLALSPTNPAAAHPLGNFSVNQYSRIEIGTDEARLLYVLDLAELPTVADRPLLDRDGDGAIAGAERESYLADKLSEIAPALHLIAGSTELALRPTAQSLTLAPGQAGLDTTRVEAVFVADLRDRRGRGTAHLPQRLRKRPAWLAGDRRRQRS
jgi:hypothetical protein